MRGPSNATSNCPSQVCSCWAWCPIGLLSEQCHMSYRRRITMGHQTVPTTYVPDHPRMWHHSLHIPIGHQTKNSEFISLPKRTLVGDQTPIGLLSARHCMSFVLRHRCQANKATRTTQLSPWLPRVHDPPSVPGSLSTPGRAPQ